MKQNGLWRLFTACLACVVVSWNGSVSAEDDVREAGGTAEPITVAVLGFDAGDGPEGGLSQMLAELLGVMLEEHSSFEMVLSLIHIFTHHAAAGSGSHDTA